MNKHTRFLYTQLHPQVRHKRIHEVHPARTPRPFGRRAGVRAGGRCGARRVLLGRRRDGRGDTPALGAVRQRRDDAARRYRRLRRRLLPGISILQAVTGPYRVSAFEEENRKGRKIS